MRDNYFRHVMVIGPWVLLHCFISLPNTFWERELPIKDECFLICPLSGTCGLMGFGHLQYKELEPQEAVFRKVWEYRRKQFTSHAVLMGVVRV